MIRDSAARYRFGPFELRPSESLLLRGGEPVAIQPQTFEALVFFVEHAGRLVTKEEVLARLWPDTFVNEEALTQLIRKLRLALGDDAKDSRYVQTVLKRGYRFLPTVQILRDASSAASPATIQAEDPARAPLPRVAPRRRRRRAWAGLLAVLALAVLAAWWTRTRAARHTARPLSGRLAIIRLTSTPEREQEPVFSPDGKTYAYAAYDAATAQFDLYLAAIAGGRRLRLTQTPEVESYPQFSPDGNQISFTRFSGERTAVIAISPLGGNERVLVADALFGAFSPDGASLAYVRRSPHGGQLLMRRDLRAGSDHEICRFPWIASPSWSPDGRSLAFTDERSVWVVAASGGEPRRVGEESESIRSIAWEPRGDAILCDASWGGGIADLWRLRLGGGPPEPVTAMRGAFHPAISRDGRHILVAAEHKIRQLWRTDPGGGNPRPLEASTTVECLDVEPAGRWLLYGDWSPKPGEASLGALDLETFESRPLADGTCGAVSPDGREIAYFGMGDEGGGLWRLDLETGEGQRIVAETAPVGFVEPNLYRRPAWSPDGRRVAYPALEPEAGLMVVARGGGALDRLARGTFGPPAWSPDGRFVAALGKQEAEPSGLYVVDAGSRESRRFGPPWSYARAAPLWDEDGRSLRILVDEARSPALLRLHLDGSQTAPPVPLGRVQDPAFWGIFDLDRTAEGGLVYLLERYEGDLYLLSATP